MHLQGRCRRNRRSRRNAEGCGVLEAKEREHLKKARGDFPGGPPVRTLHFHCRGHGFDPWSGNSDPACLKKKKKKKQEADQQCQCFWEIREMELKCSWVDRWSEEGGPAEHRVV